MIHTGGWDPEGKDIGPITVARAKAALKRYQVGDCFLVTAGSEAPATGERICRLVANWLIKQGVPADRVIVPMAPSADNTIAEVEEAVSIIGKRNLRWPIHASTSWWHIPRTWVIWRKYGQGLKPRFIPARDNGWWTRKSAIPREVIGILAIFIHKTGPRYV